MSKQQNNKNRRNESEQRPDLEPPQPPPYRPKLRIAPLQLIGIPLLALLPLLALFGVFGDSLTTTRAANEDVAVEVTYVSRYRYGIQETMSVSVTNLSPRSSATATVVFEQSYIEHFSNVNFVPNAERISTEGYAVELNEMRSGETRFVKLEMQGEQYWTQSGVISVSLSSGQPITVNVRTMIFP